MKDQAGKGGGVSVCVESQGYLSGKLFKGVLEVCHCQQMFDLASTKHDFCRLGQDQ